VVVSYHFLTTQSATVAYNKLILSEWKLSSRWSSPTTSLSPCFPFSSLWEFRFWSQLLFLGAFTGCSSCMYFWLKDARPTTQFLYIAASRFPGEVATLQHGFTKVPLP